MSGQKVDSTLNIVFPQVRRVLKLLETPYADDVALPNVDPSLTEATTDEDAGKHDTNMTYKYMYSWHLYQILHIAYSRYRAIPAIDIDIQDISVGMLTSGQAASRAARHVCMQCNRSI